jgi:mercuric ion transport protein
VPDLSDYRVRKNASDARGSSMKWRRTAAMLPGICVSLLPKLTCPMCWPAYSALLATLGLGFLISARYLFALTMVVLMLSVGALAFGARQRRGYCPAILGSGGAAFVLFGKFLLESVPLMYSGIVLLLVASIWNIWPRRAGTGCPKCVPSDSRLFNVERSGEIS